MLIKTLPVGMMATNCYIVTDETTMKCAIIDPGAESNVILDYIESHKIKPEAIFLTHGHFDHRMALENVLEAADVPVYINKEDVDRSGQGSQYTAVFDENMNFCKEGDFYRIGNLILTVMETPGHSPGSITIICTSTDAEDNPAGTEGALFTGDTLFCGDCGRTDLAGGNRNTILKSLRRLAELRGNYEVYPGHDESTTLDNERLTNMDMRFALGENEF